MNDIFSFIFAVLLMTLVTGSVSVIVYFLICKIKKLKFHKKTVLKIYNVNLLIFVGLFALTFLSAKSSNNQASGVVSLLIAIGMIFIIVKLYRSTKEKKTIKGLEETRCTCQACGNVWYYGKQEYRENMGLRLINSANQDSNCASDLLCCSGCLPALFIPRNPHMPIKDLNKCPKCNSSAVKKVQIIHDI